MPPSNSTSQNVKHMSHDTHAAFSLFDITLNSTLSIKSFLICYLLHPLRSPLAKIVFATIIGLFLVRRKMTFFAFDLTLTWIWFVNFLGFFKFPLKYQLRAFGYRLARLATATVSRVKQGAESTPSPYRETFGRILQRGLCRQLHQSSTKKPSRCPHIAPTLLPRPPLRPLLVNGSRSKPLSVRVQ